MYFLGRWRRGSIGIWGVALGAFLLVGCYIVFDVLDLDGSDLQNRLLAIAPQGAWAETERSLHQSRAATGAFSPDVLISLLPVSRLFGPLPPTTPVPERSPVRRTRPGAHTGHRPLDAPSSPDDPPQIIFPAA